MLNVVEKVILLQGVDVFSEVPSEELALLAAIVEEERFAVGDTVYAQNDPPDAMYVVVTGAVRLHRDGRDVTVAKASEAFGTWALFDEEPRVAAATALEESHVLRVDKEAFVDLLADHVRITQGVLKAIVRRLRGLVSPVRRDSKA